MTSAGGQRKSFAENSHFETGWQPYLGAFLSYLGDAPNTAAHHQSALCGASRVAAAANKRAKEEKHFMLYFIWVASYVFVGVFGVGSMNSSLYASVESFSLAATSTLNERHEQQRPLSRRV